MKTIIKAAALSLFVLASFGLNAEAFLEVEGGAAFTGYNDVRIPSDTGTSLSLATDTVPDPVFAFRVRGGYTFAGRHTLLALIAPLSVRGSGTLDRDTSYYGADFPAGTEAESLYRFDSYRLGYRYAFVKNDSLTLAAGLTAKLRSADISVMSDAAWARRSDLGVVPLIGFMAHWRFSQAFSLLLDGDALVTPFGRAEDVLLALQYRLSDSTDLRLGYRVLEGGSDGGGSVYTFALFHYAVAGISVRF